MRNRFASLSALTCFVWSAAVPAQGHLSATLSPKGVSGTTVNLRVTNDGDEPVAVYRRVLPDQLLDGGRIPSNFYTIVQDLPSGPEEAPYRGFWVRPAFMTDEDFVTLAPRESVQGDYDLAIDYELKADTLYSITFSTDLGARPADKTGTPVTTRLKLPVQDSMTSNSLTLRTPKQLHRVDRKVSHTRTDGFEDEQKEALRVAVLNASAASDPGEKMGRSPSALEYK